RGRPRGRRTGSPRPRSQEAWLRRTLLCWLVAWTRGRGTRRRRGGRRKRRRRADLHEPVRGSPRRSRRRSRREPFPTCSESGATAHPGAAFRSRRLRPRPRGGSTSRRRARLPPSPPPSGGRRAGFPSLRRLTTRLSARRRPRLEVHRDRQDEEERGRVHHVLLNFVPELVLIPSPNSGGSG